MVTLDGNKAIFSALQNLHHKETAACTTAEEIFERTKWGCSAPVGAKVSIEEGEILFHGVVLDTEGKENRNSAQKSLEEAGSVGKRLHN